MNSSDIVLSSPVKSRVWLGYMLHKIDSNILKFATSCVSTGFPKIGPIKIEFLEDTFEISIDKNEESYMEVSICRNRVNPNKKHDDGYALRFYTTVAGFDEEAQVSIMNHDDEKARPVSLFESSKRILDELEANYRVFDLLVVAEMLEFKKADAEMALTEPINELKISELRGSELTKKECEDLCFILNCSKLEDAITGRLPKEKVDLMLFFINEMSENYYKVAAYLKARSCGDDTEDPNADISSILKFVDLENGGPKPVSGACENYLFAHECGFDSMKTIISDYLVSLLNKDYDNVLRIIEVALVVHDEHLLKEAISSFLNNFHEIKLSQKFECFSKTCPEILRVILHSVRVWYTKNGGYIHGWRQSAQPTTEL